MVGLSTEPQKYTEILYVFGDQSYEKKDGNLKKFYFFLSGPGVDHVYSMNPMKEFVDNHDQHVETNFDNFVDKHGKNYETEHVKEKKKDTFR